MMAKHYTSLKCLLAACALLLMLLAGWWFARSRDWIGVPFEKQAFNALIWRDMKASEHRDIRAEMAHDLLRKHLKVGMPEHQVISLLGPQDKTWSKTEYIKPLLHDVYEYDMGHAPMDAAGQHYVLRLYFDNLGRYRSSEIVRD